MQVLRTIPSLRSVALMFLAIGLYTAGVMTAAAYHFHPLSVALGMAVVCAGIGRYYGVKHYQAMYEIAAILSINEGLVAPDSGSQQAA